MIFCKNTDLKASPFVIEMSCRASTALEARLLVSIKNLIKESIDFGPPELGDPRQLVFIKNLNKESIDFGPPELCSPDSWFILRISIRKASI